MILLSTTRSRIAGWGHLSLALGIFRIGQERPILMMTRFWASCQLYQLERPEEKRQKIWDSLRRCVGQFFKASKHNANLLNI